MKSKRRILCVEDLPALRTLITLNLRHHEVVGAASKTEGLRRASTEKFDLYLLDYYLPDGSGIELYKLIREFDPHTPVIFVTSSRVISNEQAQSLGAQGVIEKHHLVDQLPIAVNRAFGQAATS